MFTSFGRQVNGKRKYYPTIDGSSGYGNSTTGIPGIINMAGKFRKISKNREETSSKGSVDKYVKKVSRGLKLRPEKKYLDTKDSHANVHQNYYGAPGEWFDLLNGIVEGVDVEERIGRKIQMASIQIRMYLQNGATQTSGVPQAYRVLLWLDTIPGGNASDVNTILQDAGTSGRDTVLSPWKMSTATRYKCLYDHTDVLDPGSNTTNFENIYIQLKGIQIFSGSTALIGAIQTNALWLQVVSDGYLDTKYYARFRYYDQ